MILFKVTKVTTKSYPGYYKKKIVVESNKNLWGVQNVFFCFFGVKDFFWVGSEFFFEGGGTNERPGTDHVT